MSRPTSGAILLERASGATLLERASGAILVLDTASPQVSVALGTAEGVTASRTIELHRSSELLLRAVEEILDEAGETLGNLGGVAVLQGPGSFTGLRIGLATVLGWHQALGLRATAIPTLEVLASTQAVDPETDPETVGPEKTVIAVVDALRGDWTRQVFRHGRAIGEPALVAGRTLVEQGPCRLVGFGISRLAAEPWWDARDSVELIEPPPLAPSALALTARVTWEPERLIAPIYFRPPAANRPKRKPSKKASRA